MSLKDSDEMVEVSVMDVHAIGGTTSRCIKSMDSVMNDDHKATTAHKVLAKMPQRLRIQFFDQIQLSSPFILSHNMACLVALSLGVNYNMSHFQFALIVGSLPIQTADLPTRVSMFYIFFF
ncbi:hypothetical protein KFK09_015847 [Dendrobium nobile]|uniref:Uncharacterized protein n=1 Tax=Dendrobium nobile TaxID=94219 RepID=A0A8T3B8G8_DENNO|nr:hypothetical protein KFK09_015847 [Dendrobium nobile]